MNKALLILVLTGTCLSWNKIKDDTYLKSGRTTLNKTNMNSLITYFGIDSEKAILASNLEIQFGQNFTLIGDSKYTGWGINCGAGAEDELTTCEYDQVRFL